MAYAHGPERWTREKEISESLKNLSKRAASSSAEDWRGEKAKERAGKYHKGESKGKRADIQRERRWWRPGMDVGCLWREICGKSGSAWNKLVKSVICLNINNLCFAV